MRTPLRLIALTAASVAALGLAACTAEAATPPPDSAVGAPSQPANPAAALEGTWEYRVSEIGVVTRFTVGADGMVTEFWKEGTIGEMSATLAPAADGTFTLAWKAVDEENPGNSTDGVIGLTPKPGGEELIANFDVDDDGRTVTFTKAA